MYEYSLYNYISEFMGLFLKKRKLLNIILIESHNDFDCNGGAFFDYLIKNNVNLNYKIVWLLKHKIDRKLPTNVTYARLYCPSIKRAYYSWLAKYLLADCVITPKHRENQISIYLTHGAIGLKSVHGKENVHKSVDYILAGSKNYDSVYRYELSVYEHQKLLHIGFPCMDILFKDNRDELKKITDYSFSKVVLWMPTFRKGGRQSRNDSTSDLPMGIPIIYDVEEYRKLNKELHHSNILMIIKIHPMQDPSTYSKLVNLSNIIVLDGNMTKKLGIDNYRLMSQADALISDYSSVCYQFLILNRPIGFVLSDVNDLKAGLAVDNPEFFLAGPQIYNIDELKSFVYNVRDNIDTFEDKRIKLLEWLYDYRDGNACERLSSYLNLI